MGDQNQNNNNGTENGAIRSPTRQKVQCNYIANVPVSPNVNFKFDQQPYSAPVGTQVNFTLTCESGSSIEAIPVSGNITFAQEITSVGRADHWETFFNVSGEITFGQEIVSAGFLNHWDETGYTIGGVCAISGEIVSQGSIEKPNVIYVGQTFEWTLPLDITWQGAFEYEIVNGNNVIVTWHVGLGDITGSTGFEAVYVYCDYRFPSFECESVIDRGAWIRSNARFKTKIESEGYAEMLPIVMPSENVLSGEIVSESGIIAAMVIELGGKLAFQDSIRHLFGRAIFGYPSATIIKQVYEISNNRSLVIPNIPEEPAYAVFLTTTDFNLSDEELRRGTVDLCFTFDHGHKEIKRIKVWLQSPNGSISLDKMRIFDYPGGRHEPHILERPFDRTTSYRIPIHCISKKENQFYIEIEYKDASESELNSRSRTMAPKENYIIPFQAHFDNRNPFVNLADHEILCASTATNNSHVFLDSSDPITRENLRVEDRIPLVVSHHPKTFFDTSFDFITREWYYVDDRIVVYSTPTYSRNTYFKSEYDDLFSGQIGG